MHRFIDCTHPNLPGVVARLAKPFGDWTPLEESDKPVTVNQLRKYAADQGIDLGGVTKKAEIVAAIETARSQQAEKDSPTAGENTEE